MSMYTPTTPEVKRWFAGAIDEYRCDTGLSREEAEQGFDRWLQATITEASKPLERMVQELEAENTRLRTELALAESRLAEAWARGYRKHAVFGPGYSAANPYRAGGDVS